MTATLALLTAEFQIWATKQNLPEEGDAIEMLYLDLTQGQREWLTDFINRWDIAQNEAYAAFTAARAL